MQLINKNIDYAVRALLYLALQKERLVPSREIAEKEGIPLQFIRRILQALKKGGYIITKEGVQGGHRLQQAADAISVRQVIELFHGTFALSECMFRKKLCPNRGKCVLRKRIKAIEKTVADEFNGITIATLAADIGRAE